MKQKAVALSKQYPFVVITGPRQSGKTTLAKDAFPDYRKVSLEDLDNRAFAESDPRGFISTYQTKPSSMRFKEFRPCSPIFRHTAMM